VLLWRLIMRRGQWVRSLLSGTILVMALFPIAGMISTGWSVYPAWTLYKSIELFIDIAVLAAIVAEISSAAGLKSLFDWTWLLWTVVQCSVWAGAAIAPRLAFLRTPGAMRLSLNGVMPAISSNGVGHIAAILAVVALSRLLDRARTQPLPYWLLLAASLATLILSQTRSALLGFAVGAMLVMLLSRRAGVFFATAVAGVIVLLGTSAASAVVEYVKRGQDAHLLQSLSGRTDWWSFAWQRFLERPFTGYGAFAGGRFAALAQMGDQLTSSVHNTYLEAILGLGIFGVIPVLTCLTMTWSRLLASFSRLANAVVERSLAMEAVGVLAVLTVRSVFTTDLIWHPALPWLAILGYAELLRRESRATA